MKLEDFYKELNLSRLDQIRIEKCVRVYSARTSFSQIISKIVNAICHVFGKSDWQLAEHTLYRVSRERLTQHFPNQMQISNNQRQNFVKFCLNYFVTRQSIENHSYRYLIPRHTWESFSLEAINVKEALDRAPFGNGQNFPFPSLEIVNHLIESEKEAYRADVNELERYLNEDMGIAAARKFIELSNQLLDIKEVEPTLLDNMQTMLNIAKGTLDKTLEGNAIILNDKLKNLRNMHKHFQDTVNTFRRPVF